MKFFDESAKAQICVRSIVRVDVVHDLVAMVVHLNFAMRTNHFVSFSHNGILVSGVSPEKSVHAPGAVSLPSR